MVRTAYNQTPLQASEYAGPAALYIHWPFCLKKCPYCDFNSHVRDSVDQEEWRKSFSFEVKSFARLFPNLKPKSIFFGGGTPSLMEAATVAQLINDIDQAWGVSSSIEVTLEANPSSVEASRFQGYKAAGVNRLSMGVQSLHNDALKFLGRLHSSEEALAALKIARSIFDRVSIDLIYARPDFRDHSWEDELRRALDFDLSHLSLYQLTIEEGTAFHHQYERGQFSLPDEDAAADLYALTQDITNAAGLPAYEISNHAGLGQESQHNLAYWQGDPYLGLGPGAHGRAPGPLQTEIFSQAHFQMKRPEDWVKQVALKGVGTGHVDPINHEDRMIEAVMMGLRLTEGINRAKFRLIFGCDVLTLLNKDHLDPLYITVSESSVKLTRHGLPVLNHLLEKILL
ncbi:radical SAM family heme chaperone HemW [Temperatibacter marinus]|uniref:Heme chaperone HemW n=1 Tax=Temperatibacter marinus TaxID=1456591 RepID=A0AA52EI86_9PROT|nr:radical SAM family heme chaperone HemW [Temperatibacter marinus]WND03648.1 radical SAM family heme chaperone HemW [Temperatibacter marinus]